MTKMSIAFLFALLIVGANAKTSSNKPKLKTVSADFVIRHATTDEEGGKGAVVVTETRVMECTSYCTKLKPGYGMVSPVTVPGCFKADSIFWYNTESVEFVSFETLNVESIEIDSYILKTLDMSIWITWKFNSDMESVDGGQWTEKATYIVKNWLMNDPKDPGIQQFYWQMGRSVSGESTMLVTMPRGGENNTAYQLEDIKLDESTQGSDWDCDVRYEGSDVAIQCNGEKVGAVTASFPFYVETKCSVTPGAEFAPLVLLWVMLCGLPFCFGIHKCAVKHVDHKHFDIKEKVISQYWLGIGFGVIAYLFLLLGWIGIGDPGRYGSINNGFAVFACVFSGALFIAGLVAAGGGCTVRTPRHEYLQITSSYIMRHPWLRGSAYRTLQDGTQADPGQGVKAWFWDFGNVGEDKEMEYPDSDPTNGIKLLSSTVVEFTRPALSIIGTPRRCVLCSLPAPLYFEVKVVTLPKESKFAIGLSAAPGIPFQAVGLVDLSIGIQSKGIVTCGDSRIYQNEHKSGWGIIEEGDVIGVGHTLEGNVVHVWFCRNGRPIWFKEGNTLIFYVTLDKEWLQEAYRRAVLNGWEDGDVVMYPAVSGYGGVLLEANYGTKPFVNTHRTQDGRPEGSPPMDKKEEEAWRFRPGQVTIKEDGELPPSPTPAFMYNLCSEVEEEVQVKVDE